MQVHGADVALNRFAGFFAQCFDVFRRRCSSNGGLCSFGFAAAKKLFAGILDKTE